MWTCLAGTGWECKSEAFAVLPCSSMMILTLIFAFICQCLASASADMFITPENLAHWGLMIQAENIFTLYDVLNIWHIPLLLRVCPVESDFTLIFYHETGWSFNDYWLLSLFWKQDQKAHVAILKVLNLQRFVYKLSAVVFCDFNYWREYFVLISLFCSVTKEPDLKEWTARAELCDKLHKPVSLTKICLQLFFFG